MKIKAILFDMDGTLIDTEPIHKASWERALREDGFVFTDDLLMRCIGLNYASMEELFRKELKPDFIIEPYIQRAQNYTDEFERENGIPVKSGFDKLCEYLERNGIKKIVCTSSVHCVAEQVLRETGILKHFDGIIGGDDVSAGKPAPEPFIKAMELSGFTREECIVAEDSENGVKSAYNAGIRCIYIKDMKDITEKTKALAFAQAPSLAECIEIIDNIV